jgi:hypothetical protein
MATTQELQSASTQLGMTNINLLIRNNRNYIQGVGVMGSAEGGGGTSINANIEYRYDFTNFVFNNYNYTVLIQYRGVGATTYNTFSAPLNGNNVQGVVNALNSAFISQFNTYTEAGITYVSTYNNFTEFNNLYLIANVPDGIVDYLVTENGLFLVTENGEFIITQDITNILFPVEVVIYPTDNPAVLVTIQEGNGGGSGGVTYPEFINSYGLNNYEVQGLYLYSPNASQLNKPILYSSFNASGDAQVISIPNVLDPNQIISSSLVDLSPFDGSIILDGQATINTQVLPLNELQIKFLSKQITTGAELTNNFLDIQAATNTKFFEPPLQDISEFERKDAEIIDAIPGEVVTLTVTEQQRTNIRENIENQIKRESVEQQNQEFGVTPQSTEQKNTKKQDKIPFNLGINYTSIIFLGVVTLASIYLLTRKKKI